MSKKSWKMLLYIAGALLFWILLWALYAKHLGSEILLPGPKRVAKELLQLLRVSETYRTLLGTVLSVAVGFAVALVLGILFGVLSARSELLRAFLSIPMKLMKTIPVASFIILLLVWMESRRLGTMVAFLMALPIVYENVYRGRASVDPKHLEMAAVFRLRPWTRLRFLVIPTVMPYLVAAVRIGVSLSFKAGIAAEVISQARGTIGRNLYDAKLYLDIPGLFAWTLLIVPLSLLFEEVVMILIRLCDALLSRRTLLVSTRYLLRYLLFGNAEPTGEDAPDNRKDLYASDVPDSGSASVHPTIDGEPHSLIAASSSDREIKQNTSSLITLSDISAKFGERILFDHINAEITSGTLRLLTGPSGCGKTTLLRILAGLQEPTEGSVIRSGEPSISMLFQEDRLVDTFSAVENVTLGDSAKRERAEACLQAFGIRTLYSKPAGQFSGGERRRIALARAVVAEADVLLLDEAFTGMDPELTSRIISMLPKMCGTAAVVLVSHEAKANVAVRGAFSEVIEWNDLFSVK